MRFLLTLLRLGVLVFGLAGAFGSGFLGYWWWAGLDGHYRRIDSGVRGFRRRSAALGLDPREFASVPFWQELEREYQGLRRQGRAYPFLLAGAGLGLAGSLLALLGRERSAAALLLTAALGPTLLAPSALRFTFALVLAGVLALGAALCGSRMRHPAPPPA